MGVIHAGLFTFDGADSQICKSSRVSYLLPSILRLDGWRQVGFLEKSQQISLSINCKRLRTPFSTLQLAIAHIILFALSYAEIKDKRNSIPTQQNRMTLHSKLRSCYCLILETSARGTIEYDPTIVYSLLRACIEFWMSLCRYQLRSLIYYWHTTLASFIHIPS